jgi:glutamine synthetase
MSLPEAIRALQADHEFLLRGDVFTEDVISAWVEYKMERDVRPSRMHPTPMDFYLYYDV